RRDRPAGRRLKNIPARFTVSGSGRVPSSPCSSAVSTRSDRRSVVSGGPLTTAVARVAVSTPSSSTTRRRYDRREVGAWDPAGATGSTVRRAAAQALLRDEQ